MPIVKIALFYILGIITGSYLDLAPLFLFKVVALLILVSLVLFVFRLQRLNSFLLLGLSLLVGLFNYEFSTSTSSSHHIANFIFPKPVLVAGLVADIPKVKKKEIHLTIKVSSIKVDGQEISPIFGLLRIEASRYPSPSTISPFQYGEQIRVRGSLESPPRFNQSFLASKDIYAVMKTEERRIVIEEGGKNLLLRAAGKVREKMIKSIEQTLEPPSSNLLMALLLGAREVIWPEVLEDFKKSGTLHVLAISGLHLAIVAFVFFYFWQKLLGLSQKSSALLTLTLIVFYCLIVGDCPSIFRATIMISVFLLGLLLERDSNIYNSLALAALIILLLNPVELFNVGFQLSFMATLGIIYLSPILNKKLVLFFSRYLPLDPLELEATGKLTKKLTGIFKRWIILPLAVSLAAQLAVFPIIMYYFNILTPITVIANLSIIPLLTPIITAGLITFFLYLVSLPLAEILAFGNNFLLTLLMRLVHLFAQVPFISGPFLSLTLAYYGLGIILFEILRSKKSV